MTTAAHVAPLALSPQAELASIEAEILKLLDTEKRVRGRLIRLRHRVDVLEARIKERAC
jgi:hypothetical protein